MDSRFFCSLLAVLLFGSVTGCGNAVDPNRPKTFPVTGTVTHNGSPVEGASVMFVGSGQGGRGAIGKTNASGEFSMTTFDQGDGAIPGTYKVAVFKTVIHEIEESGVVEGRGGAEPVDTRQEDMLPPQYKDPNKSGLTAEVSEGENHFDFALTD